jgi:hypothetical protein
MTDVSHEAQYREEQRTLADDAALLEYKQRRDIIWINRKAIWDLNVQHSRPGSEKWKEARSSPEWDRLRLLALKRACGHCESCGYRRPLDVHHKNYRYGILCPLHNLLAICRVCHDKEHYGWWGFLSEPPRQYNLLFPANDNAPPAEYRRNGSG